MQKTSIKFEATFTSTRDDPEAPIGNGGDGVWVGPNVEGTTGVCEMHICPSGNLRSASNGLPSHLNPVHLSLAIHLGAWYRHETGSISN